MRRQTIYSIRTSLGRELWWSTSRKKTLALADEVNEIGVGGLITMKGTAGHNYKPGEGIRPHQLPLVVYRCSPISPK